MPKTKKTLKQKRQADQRRHVTSTVISTSEKVVTKTSGQQLPDASAISFALPHPTSHKHVPVKEHPVKEKTLAINTNEYSHVSRDLLKTTLLTVVIIVAELLIHAYYFH